MSTLETILNRAMSDPAFADALFADPDKALAEYNLPPEELAKFKAMSRAEFDAFVTEERRSMAAFKHIKLGERSSFEFHNGPNK